LIGAPGAICLLDGKVHATTHHLFQRDARGLVLLRVDLDPGRRPSLKLLAALRCKNDQSILRIDFRDVISSNVTVN